MNIDSYKKLWDSQEDNPKVYQALWLDLLNASGWAGVLPNGNLVDRRYFPEATPVQENSMFGINKPKEVASDDYLPLEHRIYNKVKGEYDNIITEIKASHEQGEIEYSKIGVPSSIIIKDTSAILGFYPLYFNIIINWDQKELMHITYFDDKMRKIRLVWGELENKYQSKISKPETILIGEHIDSGRGKDRIILDEYNPELFEEGLGDKDYKYHKYLGEYVSKHTTIFLFTLCNKEGSLKDNMVIHRSPTNILKVIDQSKMIYELR